MCTDNIFCFWIWFILKPQKKENEFNNNYTINYSTLNNTIYLKLNIHVYVQICCFLFVKCDSWHWNIDIDLYSFTYKEKYNKICLDSKLKRTMKKQKEIKRLLKFDCYNVDNFVLLFNLNVRWLIVNFGLLLAFVLRKGAAPFICIKIPNGNCISCSMWWLHFMWITTIWPEENDAIEFRLNIRHTQSMLRKYSAKFNNQWLHIFYCMSTQQSIRNNSFKVHV